MDKKIGVLGFNIEIRSINVEGLIIWFVLLFFIIDFSLLILVC